MVVLGDVMTDVIARMAGPLATGSDTPAEIVLRPGGSAANTAAWLGHLGVPVVMVGCVGDDALGRDAARALEGAGVVPALAVAPGMASGACVVLVDGEGERSMLPDAGANAGLRPGHLPQGAFQAGGHLHVSGYALIREGSRPAAVAALEAARRAGMSTSVDAASAAPLAALGAAAFHDLVAGVGLMVVTLDEAAVLCGTREPDRVAEILGAAHPEVVLKRGGDGADWHGPDGAWAHAGAVAPPGPVADTTGAGDAFVAALLAARRGGAAPADALARACGLAARVVTTPGARPAP